MFYTLTSQITQPFWADVLLFFLLFLLNYMAQDLDVAGQNSYAYITFKAMQTVDGATAQTVVDRRFNGRVFTSGKLKRLGAFNLTIDALKLAFAWQHHAL